MRDLILEKVKNNRSKNLLLELPTGFGKSRIAIELINDLPDDARVLVVVPKNVLKQNWKDEIIKWGGCKNARITYTTYASISKYTGFWEMVIFDECHHITEKVIDDTKNFITGRNILLSATVSDHIHERLKRCFGELGRIKIDIKEAIAKNVLPSPNVLLVPLYLDDIRPICNTGNGLYRTQAGYYSYISKKISFFKERVYSGMTGLKQTWLALSGSRLRWLSKQKIAYVKDMLFQMKGQRYIVFCNNTEDADKLGIPVIHSKVKSSRSNLDEFNIGQIDNLACIGMLDEGVNLYNCEYAIHANLSNSERLIKQRLGRVLRHENPTVIIPFFMNTREEEILKKMMNDYDLNKVKTTYYYKDKFLRE